MDTELIMENRDLYDLLLKNNPSKRNGGEDVSDPKTVRRTMLTMKEIGVEIPEVIQKEYEKSLKDDPSYPEDKSIWDLHVDYPAGHERWYKRWKAAHGY